MELGCINCPIMSKFKKTDFTRSDKKDSSYRQIVLSFRRDFAPVTRQFFAPSLYNILCDGFQLSNPVGYRYLYYTVRYQCN